MEKEERIKELKKELAEMFVGRMFGAIFPEDQERLTQIENELDSLEINNPQPR